MAKKDKSRKHSAKDRAADFEHYYGDLFGGRWPGLKDALLGEPGYFDLNAGLRQSYFLDEASVISASYLEAGSEHRILDMCAAPGGKSLVILSNIISQSANPNQLQIDMTCNERSAARRGRLKTVLADHLPAELSSQIAVTNHDAGKWGLHEQNCYDRIMLDVPCSSERHVMKDSHYLEQWSQSRIKRLAQQAYSFVLSALMALAPGGTLVYSTCALNRHENDEVIDRVLTRILKKNEMSVMTANTRNFAGGTLPDWVEDQSLGFAVLPDKAQGRGPMYFSRLRKL